MSKLSFASRLIRFCESIEDSYKIIKSLNKVELLGNGDKFNVDVSSADNDRSIYIQKIVNNLIESNDWNRLSTEDLDNTYVIEYKTNRGTVKEYRSNNKKFSDLYVFSDKSEAEEFFNIINGEIEKEDSNDNSEIVLQDEINPDDYAQESNPDVDASEENSNFG